jgi:hypothetical protein
VHSGSSSPKGLAYVEFREELKAHLSPEAWIRAIKTTERVVARTVSVDNMGTINEIVPWAGEDMGQISCMSRSCQY